MTFFIFITMGVSFCALPSELLQRILTKLTGSEQRAPASCCRTLRKLVTQRFGLLPPQGLEDWVYEQMHPICDMRDEQEHDRPRLRAPRMTLVPSEYHFSHVSSRQVSICEGLYTTLF